MTENKKYCMGCMKEIDLDASVCPHCYYNEETVQHYPCLPKGTVIADRYLVGRTVSMANDSITYIGLDTETEEIVSVNEFYPVKICEREQDLCSINIKLGCEDIFGSCLQSFISMWKAIGSVKGQISLPVVRNILDFNGTVYTVCKYTDSITLKAYFEETGKPLSWQKAQSAFKGILTALEKLHGAGVIHGGISPTSVHVGSDGKLHLTSFSIPECRTADNYLAVAPLNGFSPLELYGENRMAETASDIYSLMSLIYYCITGTVPPKATDRAVKDEMVIPSAVASSLSKNSVSAFIRGLAVNKENRIRSATELYSLIYQTRTYSVSDPARNSAPSTERKAPARKEQSSMSKKTRAKQIKKESGSSLAVLAIGTFTAVAVVCMLIFCVLYATVLYKNYDIPVLNDAFASFDFLPMNQNSVSDDFQVSQDSTSATAPVNRYVTVPDFTSHTYDSVATNSTFTRNFIFEFVFEYNDDVPKNAVISQNLVKGESVIAGTTVTLIISRGSEQIELPEVIGLQFADAESELTEKGFKVKKVLLDNDGTHTAGIVEMTDKVSGLEFDKGTEIVLSVWDEAEKKEDKEKDKNKTETKKSNKKDKKKSDSE